MLKTVSNQGVLSRRRVLQFGAIVAVGLCPIAQAHAARSQERALGIHNLHTGERFSRVYWAEGRYLSESLAEIDLILRDWRTDDIHPIEPGLLDTLHRVRTALRTDQSFDVISGYRSPKTNAKLAAQSSGVAKKSLHMRGMAIDVTLPDRKLTDLRDAAWKLQQGGVGFYPKSGFVHLDVGRVRRW